MNLIQDFVDGFTKAARAAGRRHSVQMDVPGMYEAGKYAALSTMGLQDKLDLAGLGLLGVPVVHSLVTGDKDESPGVSRAKSLAELAGLGTLAASTFSKLH